MSEGEELRHERPIEVALEEIHGSIMNRRLNKGDSALNVTIQGEVKTSRVGLESEEEAFDSHLLAGCRGPRSTLWS